jgi:hypothetical protein
MNIFKPQWLLFPRVLILIILIITPIISSLISVNPVNAAGWPGWNGINTIYYNPAQEDANNPYLQTAAQELKTYLEQMSGKSWTVTNSYPPSPAVYLSVNATQLSAHGSEASRLVVNNIGVTITGKTALAVREGAYGLLERLGVRWFFKSDAWTVVPSALVNLSDMDVIDEPDYFYRYLGFYPHSVDMSNTYDWIARNRLGGDKRYFVGATYSYIFSNPSTLFLTHPEYFYPTGARTELGWPWQLNPSNPDVIAQAITYARNTLSGSPSSFEGQNRVYGAVSVTPNDGPGWSPPYSDSQWQTITDKVYSLANAVAANISADYPDRYVSVYSYALYAGIPTISLNPNILAEIGIAYNYTPLSLQERIDGLVGKGIKVGIRDYLDVWGWWEDDPALNGFDKAQSIKYYHDNGIDVYHAESLDSWGATGLTYYMVSKLLWDSSLNLDDVADDFYEKAFGAASAVMKEYYENLNTDNVSVGTNFLRLAEAETLVKGDSAILERLRQLEYYQRFLWKYHTTGLSSLSLSDLESFYTFITKIRNLYIINYVNVEEAVRAELISRGLTGTQVNALQNFTAPTSQEATNYLNEALAAFNGTIPDINPYTIDLVSSGDTSHPVLTSFSGSGQAILIPSNGNENITINVKGHAGYSVNATWSGDITWWNPDGNLIETKTISAGGTWVSYNVTATAPGNYLFKIPYSTSFGFTIDVPNHAASLLCSSKSPRLWGQTSNYFYVPADTETFVFELYPSGGVATGQLIDPNGNTALNFASSNATEYRINTTVPGTWKCISTATYNVSYSFRGIPPLIWHDPQYLLVQTSSVTPVPPVLSPIGNKTTHPGWNLQFSISATDQNGGNLTYSASNLPAWASFNPATRTFSGTANQTGTYNNIVFQVSDGTFTDSESVNITVLENHAPALNAVGNKIVNEGSALAFTVSANDTDGDALTYSVSNMPSGATINPATGLFSWTPSYTQAGIYNNICFNATDSAISDSDNITITVNNVNRAPVISTIGNKTVYEGSTLTFTVSASDPDGDSLTYSASNLPFESSFNGTSRIFSWAPGSGKAGNYTNILFSAYDGSLTTSETITITVAVVPANPTPAPAGGGGGGGSSSGSGGGASGITSLMGSMSASGRAIEEITASDINLKLTVRIPFGTLVKKRVGAALTSIRITPLGESQAAKQGSVLIGQSFEVEPSGATFEASAFLVFRYSPSDIPADISVNNLYIALWDPIASVWTDLGGKVDPSARTITVPIQHLSTYALMARTRPADFKLSNITLSSREILSGETITASIDINNQGDLSGNYTANLKINNTMAQTKSIVLSGGSGDKVSFTFVPDAVGEYQISIGDMPATFVVKKPQTPAAFTIDNLTVVPLSSNIGDYVDVSALLKNTGDMAGAYKVVLSVDDLVVETEEVKLEGNSSLPIGFSFIADVAGQHKISIGSLLAPFEVKAQSLLLPPPSDKKSNLEISSFSISPNYDKTTNTLIYTMITYQMDQSWDSFLDSRLMLTVFHDSQFLEQVTLFALGELQQDGRTGKLSYVPSAGWEPGEYAFRAELFSGDELIQDTPLRRLSVTPESAASVVSWKTLSIIIGSALVLGSLILTLVLYYRRDMLHDYWK